MPALRFEPPASLPEAARRSIQCARVPGTAAPVEACVFDGGHCLPWQHWVEYDCNWTKASEDGRMLHELVWRRFLRGGALALSPEP